jgi:hypothetical protein
MTETKDETATLEKIYKELQTISKDQKHIGEFLGENVHSIRKLLVFFAILTVINIVLTLLF